MALFDSNPGRHMPRGLATRCMRGEWSERRKSSRYCTPKEQNEIPRTSRHFFSIGVHDCLFVVVDYSPCA